MCIAPPADPGDDREEVMQDYERYRAEYEARAVRAENSSESCDQAIFVDHPPRRLGSRHRRRGQPGVPDRMITATSR